MEQDLSEPSLLQGLRGTSWAEPNCNDWQARSQDFVDGGT